MTPTPDTATVRSTLKTWLLLGLILLSGLGLRLAYLAESRHSPLLTQPELDELYHDYWAKTLAFGKADLPANVHPPELDKHPYFRPPGYPFFLAAVYQCLGSSPITIRLVQHLIGICCGFLVFLLVRRWFGDAMALLSAALAVGTWFMVYYEGILNAPVLLAPLIVLILGSLARQIEGPSLKHGFIAGLFLGLYAVIRPEILTFFPLAALWLLSLAPRGFRMKTYGVPIVAMGLGAGLIIAPVTIRNLAVSGEPVLISANGGINFFFGNNDETGGMEASHSSIGAWNCFDYPRLVRDLSATEGREFSYGEASSYFFRQGLTFLGEQPLDGAKLLFRKFLLFWGPREVAAENDIETQRRSSAVLRSMPTQFSFLLGIGLTGWLMLLRRKPVVATLPLPDRRLLNLILLWVFSYTSTVILFFVSSRYRTPVLPFLYIGAAYALLNFWLLLTREAAKAWVPWLAIGLAITGLVSLNPTGARPHPEAWHLSMATSCVKAGQLDAARQHLETALRLAPTHSDLHYRLGSLARIQRQTDEAKRLLYRAIELDARHLQALIELGSIHAVEKDFKKAEGHFRNAVAISPGSGLAKLCLGETLLAQGRADEAAPYLEQGAALDTRLHTADHFLGTRAMQAGDWSKAASYFKHWTETTPSNALAHAMLARTLAPLGRKDEAKAALDKAFALDPALEAKLLEGATSQAP